MRRTGLLGAALLLAVLAGTPAMRAAELPPDGEDAFRPLFATRGSDAPVAFSGDTFYWDRNTDVISGYGAVELEQGMRTIQADEIQLYLKKEIAELKGNVAISQEGQTVFGESATYDLADQRGTFVKPRTHAEPWYISADDFTREGPAQYRARRSRVTTCDRNPPHWALNIGDLEIDEEERVVKGQNVVGRVGPVPVFYAPLYSQRLDRKRPPIEYDVGYTSDVGGFVRFAFPFDVNENIELQPQIDLFTESGVGGGLEAEGRLFETTSFVTDLWYISDMNHDNVRERGITRDRHKFDWYSRTTLPDDWVALAQLEWLSDRRVLETFFWDEYREREEPESFIDFTRTKPHTVVEITAQKRLDDYTLATDQLPLVQGDLLEFRLFDSPVFVDAHADVSYSELKPNDRHITASRQEVRLSAPYRFGRWMTAVPFMELEGRYHDAGNIGTRNRDYETWLRPGITLQNRYHAVFASPLKRYTRMRHLFEPTLTYAYRSAGTPDPEDIAFFDPSERHLNENSIELELRNKIQGRRLDGAIENLIEYRATLGAEFEDGTDHLATVENELIIRPANRWVFSAQSFHNLRREAWAADVHAVLRYTDPLGYSAYLGVLYTDARFDPWRADVFYGASIPVSDTWRVGFEHRYRVEDGDLDQQEYWVWHQFHCWEAALSVVDRNESITFMVQIGLSAFPNPAMRHYRDKQVLADDVHHRQTLFGNDVNYHNEEIHNLDLAPHAADPADGSARLPSYN